MSLANLSSNWKKLQQKIKGSDSGTTTTKNNSLKRKSTNEQPPAAPNGAKRKKINASSSTLPADKKRRKMGSLLSKESASDTPTSTTTPTNASASAFAHEHNIPLADVEAAYNLSKTPTTTNYHDEPNAGLTTSRQPGKYIALDCEMVGVGPDPDSDSQLARVSVVDFNGHQLYDSFVLPQLPVTDYRTHVSGITPSNLRSGRPFAEVQRAIAALLAGRILVGHALKHDMGVLQLSHPRRDIRDTARHPAFRARSMGRAPALRKLAKEVLGLDIQGGEHSSVEDARATMALFRADKEAFEREHARRWGRGGGAGGASRTTSGAMADGGDGEGEEEATKTKGKSSG
ncbi:putative RNA exonuclease [Phyllosticta capitalensis]